MKHPLYLTTLHTLTISFAEHISSFDIIFSPIFDLSTFKYCKSEYQPFFDYFTNYASSPIEYLIINGRFQFSSFHNLLSCLPKLQHLSINSLVDDYYYQKNKKLSPIQLKYLKYVSLKLDCVYFDEFEKIIKEFFHHIQILHLTTVRGETYLDAKR
ncbi:unnamed protein product [Rotaria sordida]|uniref:Uncharacterized protein n=1 Tax=Rotaria sordida TaxID=392033 RepID=A0A819YN22_9BILA|nr:unnamed protein product [Rotaria sordida]CAF4160782.1 unnamed protein product [Rotaria sordida]